MTDRKRILVLGSTGSIGTQTLELARTHPDRLEVVGLAAGHKADTLVTQAAEFGVGLLGLADATAAARLDVPGARVFAGADGICALVEPRRAASGDRRDQRVHDLRPLLVALEAGSTVRWRTKEPLVAAGRIVMETARQGGARLLPIDSELSAIFQCLRGERVEEVEKVLLTASGGPFARLSEEELMEVTPERALDHPTWKMGRKVTIDSATLANKGFEVFEVHWLFGVDVRQIEVLVHHQSIIHSLVQFRDGSVIAQMAPPDMRMPIAFALFYPERVANDLPRLSLAEVGSLTFAPPDTDHFPCLRLAFDAARAGRSYPAVLNAANEVAVGAPGRPPRLHASQSWSARAHRAQASRSCLADVEAADAWAREYVRRLA